MKTAIKTILAAITLLLSTASFAVPPALNSNINAQATIYLDFDGENVIGTLWNSNGSRSIDCLAAPLTNTQIQEIFNRVSEDYRPFDVNVTTDESVYLNAPFNKRIRVIVTPTSAWQPGVGGIGYVGSFTWGDDTPCFVFCDRLGNNAKYVAECCSHESGHTLGLSHQSTYNTSCSLVETYCTGTGSGETSWAPIMGNSYYKNMTGWDVGPTPYGCNVVQDNLTIITSQNGFTYRTDDYGDIINNTTYTIVPNTFSINGIITTQTDKDAFQFGISGPGPFHLEALPFSVNSGNNGSNLDIKIELYNQNKTLIRTFDPVNSMSIIVDTNLNAGTYFIVLTGTGNMNTDDYGSLGSYQLIGLKDVLMIHDISLTGASANGRHTLNWRVTADEPLTSQTVEYSTDGADYIPLFEAGTMASSYSYTPPRGSNYYYRIKVISQTGQVAYSNVISLRSAIITDRRFFVTTLVSSTITVNASAEFTYRLADLNGRILATGKGLSGFNNINVMNRPGGMYLLQIITDDQITTERIIKQ